MQEAFRSQVEEQAKLWQEALHGSETMKAQIRQMILYHSLCEAKRSIREANHVRMVPGI